MRSGFAKAAARPIFPSRSRCRTSSTPSSGCWTRRGQAMSARILVVDDIEANVKLLEARLTAEYYEVLTASDGPTALALAASEKPDIVLLDVMMPGMDGV